MSIASIDSLYQFVGDNIISEQTYVQSIKQLILSLYSPPIEINQIKIQNLDDLQQELLRISKEKNENQINNEIFNLLLQIQNQISDQSAQQRHIQLQREDQIIEEYQIENVQSYEDNNIDVQISIQITIRELIRLKIEKISAILSDQKQNSVKFQQEFYQNKDELQQVDFHQKIVIKEIKQKENTIQFIIRNKDHFSQEYMNLLILQHFQEYNDIGIGSSSTYIDQSNWNQQQNSLISPQVSFIEKKIERKIYMFTLFILKTFLLTINHLDQSIKESFLKIISMLNHIGNTKIENQTSKIDLEIYSQYYKNQEFRQHLSKVGEYIRTNQTFTKYIHLRDEIPESNQYNYRTIVMSVEDAPLKYIIKVQPKLLTYMKKIVNERMDLSYLYNFPEEE